MGKVSIKVSERFLIVKDEKGVETHIIFNPPVIAQSANIKIELRKEKNHDRPHIHLVKKGKKKSIDVSLALDDFSCLAGEENLKCFERDEYLKVLEFLIANKDRFKELYKKLRGEL